MKNNKANPQRLNIHMMTCLDMHCKALQYSLEKTNKRKLNLFEKIRAEFPPSDSHYSVTIGLIDAFFSWAVQMIFIGNIALAYLEICAVLERVLKVYLPKKIAKHDKANEIIRNHVKRCHLFQLAETAYDLGLWTAEDASFIKRILKIRNAFAHRDYKAIYKTLGIQPDDFLKTHDEIEKKLKKRDVSGDFVRVLRLIIKFSRHKRKGHSKQGAYSEQASV